MSAARDVHYMLCCQAWGDMLGMHLGVQCVHDGEDGEDSKGGSGEDGEDSKGGSGAEGGSQAWWLLGHLGVVPSSWGPPGWLWRPWECPGTRTCSTNGPCMHHAQTMGGIKAPRLM